MLFSAYLYKDALLSYRRLNKYVKNNNNGQRLTILNTSFALVDLVLFKVIIVKEDPPMCNNDNKQRESQFQDLGKPRITIPTQSIQKIA